MYDELLENLAILVLSGFVGFAVISKVPNTLHTPLNLPATMPEHASELYSKNITALLELLIKDGKLAPDFDDEIVAAACVTRRAGDDAEQSDAEERR